MPRARMARTQPARRLGKASVPTRPVPALAAPPSGSGPSGSASGTVSLGARLLLWPIVAYRRWVSPGLPPRCRFYPSCSEYALVAITTHGPVRGLGLGIWRLLRCHPFHPGGIDYVPPRRTPSDATTRLEQ